eukprot:TRINITY_DN660_c0_g1_i2.p1 TRINITY_DN660_c0_g1~~TRINITY_DN660_c0_g1_i2.p1  ORF type:complete len:472 (-),score=40.84 TRINITY_DN660_c0_g1_i2:525-1748(-)
MTIIDSIDTLWIMGLAEEYQKASDWLKTFTFNSVSDTPVSTFETTIRCLGGLLSIYGLTKEPHYLSLAEDIGKRLLNAFGDKSVFPCSRVSLRSGKCSGASHSSLAEVGTIQLEFYTLAKFTNNPAYAIKPLKVFDHLLALPKPNGLYSNRVRFADGSLTKAKVTLGGNGDSYYEYLLKMALLTGNKEKKYLEGYFEAMDAVETHMLQRTKTKRRLYIAELNNPDQHKQYPNMDHLACFAGGMFALGGIYATTDVTIADRHLSIGADLTETCVHVYQSSKTGLAPERFTVRGGENFQPVHDAYHYILRPETVESLFILYRATNDEKYREWGWEIFQAIEKNCRHPTGYAGVRNVNSVRSRPNDNMESFFLAETLKYLYLLFSPPDVIPLDSFVFNTEAHPLPIMENL